jgi:hypothetical protein
MIEVNNKHSLKEKWKGFFDIVFDPWVLLMTIATIIFICYSLNTDNKELIAISTLIISLCSGLLGGIIVNKWSHLTELKVLVVRGKSAIRSLKLILLNISNIEKRTKIYIASINENNNEFKLITSYFEEIIEKCNILEEEIISSIENWTDVIPEVENLKTQIGLISEIKSQKVALETEISSLIIDIETIKEEESKEKDELRKRLIEKESDLLKTRKSLATAENKINASILSGITSGSSLMGVSNVMYGSTGLCTKCGKWKTGINIFSDGLCDECRSGTQQFISSLVK